MKIEIKEIIYETESSQEGLPKELSFDISDEIAASDDLLTLEVERLVLEKTGFAIRDCLVELD